MREIARACPQDCRGNRILALPPARKRRQGNGMVDTCALHPWARAQNWPSKGEKIKSILLLFTLCKDFVLRIPAFIRLIPYTPVPPTYLTACGSRRQIALDYELPTELIDNHLIDLPHYGRPCTQAPHTVAAERKPAGYQNSRMATRRYTKIDRITVPHNTKPKANRTKTVKKKHISRRGQSSTRRRLSDTRRNNKSLSSETPHTT